MDKLYFNIQGRGKRIFFLHGWNHSHLIWSQILPFYKDNFECFFIDLPGFGESNKFNPTEISVNVYANIILKCIMENSTGKEVFGIISDSLGALVALKILEKNSISVKKIVLCGCPINGLNNILSILKIKGLISSSLYFLKMLPSPIASSLIKIFSRYTVTNSRNISEDIVESVQKVNPVVAEKIYKSISKKQNYDYDIIKNNGFDFIVLRGENDRIISKSTSLELSSLLNCEYYEFPNSGHTPMQENPQMFTKKTLEFFNRRGVI